MIGLIDWDIPHVVTDQDIRYFQGLLDDAIATNQSDKVILRIRQQLELLKDAIVIYHEHRLHGE